MSGTVMEAQLGQEHSAIPEAQLLQPTIDIIQGYEEAAQVGDLQSFHDSISLAHAPGEGFKITHETNHNIIPEANDGTAALVAGICGVTKSCEDRCCPIGDIEQARVRVDLIAKLKMDDPNFFDNPKANEIIKEGVNAIMAERQAQRTSETTTQSVDTSAPESLQSSNTNEKTKLDSGTQKEQTVAKKPKLDIPGWGKQLSPEEAKKRMEELQGTYTMGKKKTANTEQSVSPSVKPQEEGVEKQKRTIPDHIAQMVNQAATRGSKEKASQAQDREKEVAPTESSTPNIATPKERIIPPHIQQMMREKTQQTKDAQPDTQPVPPVAEQPSSPPDEPANSRAQAEEQQKNREDRATVSTVTESNPTHDVDKDSSRSINHQETQQHRQESNSTPTYESNAEVKPAETAEHNSQDTHIAPEPPSDRFKPKQARPSGPPPSDRSTIASKEQPQQKSDVRRNDVIADKTHSLNNTEIPSNIAKDSQAQTEATANQKKTYEVRDSRQSETEEYRPVEPVVDNATQQRIERHQMRNTHESETSISSPSYLSQDTEVKLPQEQTNQPAYQEPAPPTPRQQDRFIEDNNRPNDNVTSLEQAIPIPAFEEEQPSSPVAVQEIQEDTSVSQQSEVHTFIRPDNEPHVDSLEQTIPIPQVIREEDTPQSPIQEVQSPEPISHETDHGANSDVPPTSIPKTDAQSKSIEDTISNGDHTADTVTVEQAIPVADTLNPSESIPTVENKDIDQFPSGHTETLFSLDELTDESVTETVSLIQEDTTLDIPEAIEFTKDQEMLIEVTSDSTEEIYETVDQVLDDKTEEATEEIELTEVSDALEDEIVFNASLSTELPIQANDNAEISVSEINESINIELGTQTEKSELENVQEFTEETPAESRNVILEATDLQQNEDPEVLVAEQQEIDTETLYISPDISEKRDVDVNEVVLDTFDDEGEETFINDPTEDIMPSFVPLEEESFTQFLIELFSDQHEPNAVADNEVKIAQQNEPELPDEGIQDTEDIPAVVETAVPVTSEVEEFIVPHEGIEIIPVEATEANLFEVIEELVQDQEIAPVMILALPVDEYTDPSQEIKDEQILPEVGHTSKEEKKFDILMLQQEEVISFILLIQQITDILAFLQNTNKETSFMTDMDFTNELDVSPEELKNDTFGKYDDTVVQTLFPLVQFMFFIQDLQIFIPQQVKKENQLTTFA